VPFQERGDGLPAGAGDGRRLRQRACGVTQRNFDAKAHSAEEIEKIKLEDGVRLHETTKVELLTYPRAA
jgi:hypothetical protein